MSKSFGKANVWRDLAFTIPAGEISDLLGPSGTGKSTKSDKAIRDLVMEKMERVGLQGEETKLPRLRPS